MKARQTVMNDGKGAGKMQGEADKGSNKFRMVMFSFRMQRVSHIFPPLFIYLISGVTPPLPEQPIPVVSMMDETGVRSQESS